MSEQVIAISGQPGSGSTTAGKLLAKKLSLEYFSPGRMWKDLASGNIEQQSYYSLFSQLCEKKNLVVPQFNAANDSHGVITLWDSEFGRSKAFNEVTDELQVVLANNGAVVIDGKLSLHMIKNANIRIWLKASFDARAKRTLSRDGLSAKEASEVLQKREVSERKEWKNLYGFDYFDQEHSADLVIDTSQLSPEQVVERILECVGNNFKTA